MTRIRQFIAIVALAAAFASTGAAFAQEKVKRRDEAQMQKENLYVRLGGKAGVAGIVELFVQNVAGDTAINHYFARTDLRRFERLLNEQVCMVAGGPCTYAGKSMKEAHKGMRIRSGEFDALMADMGRALDARKVEPADKTALMMALAALKGDVIEQ